MSDGAQGNQRRLDFSFPAKKQTHFVVWLLLFISRPKFVNTSDKVQRQGIAQKKHTVHCTVLLFTVVTDLDLGEGGQHGDAPLHGEGDGGVHGAGEAHVDQGQHVRGHEGEHVLLGIQS